ncbi:hypothetical protein [Teredinibacter sp. KSP-S5-2]|uniref:hypothetical protein n=1 Tax=Teredinibacter sp. KSP-S5-2 TaxID=3034506 RepID=UPI0029347BBB|nr:hypothetical protein [Teredinibacter sp. KSP-S5-2]WNO08671.1 hypothetical protein P5V12_17000 [Teredinibacter sp. KSP-S5-2]
MSSFDEFTHLMNINIVIGQKGQSLDNEIASWTVKIAKNTWMKKVNALKIKDFHLFRPLSYTACYWTSCPLLDN